MHDDIDHRSPSLADRLAGTLKRGVAEIVGSHDLLAEGVAQEHEGNPLRVDAEARAAVQGDESVDAGPLKPD